jgi:hypothetical protein
MALSIKNESIHVFSFTRILHEAMQTACFADDKGQTKKDTEI